MDGFLPQTVKRAEKPELHDLGDFFTINAAHAAPPLKPVETVGAREIEPVLPQELQIYAGSLYAWAICWLITIIGTTQALKVSLRGILPPRAYDQLKRMAPVVISTASAPMFGPPVARAFGFEFTPEQALMLFGPGAGVAAMGVYSIFIPERFKAAMGSLDELTPVPAPEPVEPAPEPPTEAPDVID
jgi:hypothetical protein